MGGYTEAALVIYAFKAGMYWATVFETVILREDFALVVCWFFTYKTQQRDIDVGTTGKVVQLLLFICAFAEWTAMDDRDSWCALALHGWWTVPALLVIFDVANYLNTHKVYKSKQICELVHQKAFVFVLLRSVVSLTFMRLFGYNAPSIGLFPHFVKCVCECIGFTFVAMCML